MDVQAIAQELLKKLGGKENIVSVEACMTRLRVELRDVSQADVAAIRAMSCVMGVVESEGLQIVLGPGTVRKVLDALRTLLGEQSGAMADDAASFAKQSKAKQASEHANPLQRFLKHVANIFVPLLPGIVAAGFINGIANAINVPGGIEYSGVWWYETIRTLGWALFTYLPIFAGYSAAYEFGGSPILGGIVGALSVAHPNMPLLSAGVDGGVILPMTGSVYNPGSGGLLAALFAGAAIALLERKLRSIMPDAIDSFATPLLALGCVGLVLVSIVQPLSTLIMQGVFNLLSLVYDSMGIFGGYLLAAGFLPLVSLGLHQALLPLHAMLNDPAGPTEGINYLLPVLMMAGGGQVGAGIALYFKTHNQRLKGYIRDAVPVGLLGIGEPLMYAVTLPLGRPFVTACLGAGFGGALARFLHIGAVAQGVSGIFGVLIVGYQQEAAYLVSLLVAALGGFVLTWFWGVDEQHIAEVYGE